MHPTPPIAEHPPRMERAFGFCQIEEVLASCFIRDAFDES